jgi:hypothetical protein
MQDEIANIVDKKILFEMLPQIELHGLIISKSKAAKILGTSRNTFDKDFIDTKYIEPIVIHRKEKFSLLDVLAIPGKIKERKRLNDARCEMENEKRGSSNNKTIDQIFNECYRAVKVS